MAKGKYAAVIDSLPRSFGEEPEYQEKINAVKRELLGEPNPAEPPLDSDVIEELLLDVEAMLKVINDGMVRPITQRTSSGYARVYRDVRKIKAIFEAQEKITNVLLKALEQIVVDQYESEDLSNLKLYDGDSVRVDLQPHAIVEDKVANRQWAIENGLENSLSLPWQTVNALAKQALLAGEEPPAGVKVESRPKVVYTRG